MIWQEGTMNFEKEKMSYHNVTDKKEKILDRQ